MVNELWYYVKNETQEDMYVYISVFMMDIVYF